MPEAEREATLLAYTALAAAPKVYLYERQVVAADGSLRWLLWTDYPIVDGTGQVVEFQSVGQDITERKANEAALRQLNEELEQRVETRTAELRLANLALEHAAHAKDEFLASMSHDLRTPLSSILGAAEGLQEQVYGPLSDRQLRALAAIRTSADHLLGLINDILDLAKVGSGQLTIQMDIISVADVCQSSLQLIRGLSQKKHQRIGFAMEPPVIALEADARRLKQMLVNLLSNAVKFTPEEGRIGLDVEADETTQTVRFTVWDTGIGIESADLPRLFQPFTQLDNSLAPRLCWNRPWSGTGTQHGRVARRQR